MPRNNGVYTLPSVYLAQDGETIQPNQHNIPLQDIAQALTGSLPRDGSATMTGNLPMGGRKVTGLGTATAPGDAVRLDQVIQNTGWLQSVAALPMVADRIPYATGAASAALAVFTAAGRAIVGAADAAAQRLALGLGALATKNKAAVADIDATGTPGSGTFLRGDGSWSDSTSAWRVIYNNTPTGVGYVTVDIAGLGDIYIQYSELSPSTSATLNIGLNSAVDGWVDTPLFASPIGSSQYVTGGAYIPLGAARQIHYATLSGSIGNSTTTPPAAISLASAYGLNWMWTAARQPSQVRLIFSAGNIDNGRVVVLGR